MVLGLAVGAVTVVAACGGSSSGGGSGVAAPASGSGPITIGTSLSLSGDFAADGQAFEKGYQLWAADQNKKGGLLGHQVKLNVISDSSSPAQVVTNYQKLIGSNQDPLVFGPFSTLLTIPSARVAARYGYAFVEGAGGGPAVFGAGLQNVFDVSMPVKNNLVTFAQWVASLPAAQRPKTAAYATVNEPFTQPQLPVAQKILQAAGVKTVVSKVFPAEVTDYTPIAGQVAAPTPTWSCSARSTCRPCRRSPTPSSSSITTPGVHRHRWPRPGRRIRQGGRGPATRTGSSCPTAGTPASRRPTASRWSRSTSPSTAAPRPTISADVAEAYSVGQVMAQAVQATHSFDHAKIIAYLHSGVTFDSVQGPVKFDSAR